MGAGLGGGSADAAFVVKGLSEVFGLGLDADIMERLAARTGSDTAFFINNRASVSTGRGEVLSPVELPLSGKRLVIVKPEVSVSTAMAYAGVVPRERDVPLAELLARPVERWRESVSNDFEDSVFRAFPVIGAIKRKLYGQGALYASMSGSGSAVFGIFDPDSEYTPSFDDMFVYQEDIL